MNHIADVRAPVIPVSMAKDTKRSDYSVDPLAGMRSRPANDGHGNDDSGQSPHCECFGQPLLKHDSTIVLGDRLEASEPLTGGNPGLPGHPQNGRGLSPCPCSQRAGPAGATSAAGPSPPYRGVAELRTRADLTNKTKASCRLTQNLPQTSRRHFSKGLASDRDRQWVDLMQQALLFECGRQSR